MSTRLLSSRHHAHVSVSARSTSSRSGVARQPSLIVQQTFLDPAPHFSNHKVRGMTSPRSDHARAGSHETKFRDTANRLATVWVSDMFLRYHHQPQTLHYSDAAQHVRTVKTCHVKQLRPGADEAGVRATRAARRNGPIRYDTRLHAPTSARPHLTMTNSPQEGAYRVSSTAMSLEYACPHRDPNPWQVLSAWSMARVRRK